MKTAAEVAREIEQVAQRFPWIIRVHQLDLTQYAAKYRLELAKRQTYVQVYVNVRNGTHGYALVRRGQRLYGRDSEAGQWHRHPWGAPKRHDDSPAGKRAVSVAQFLQEVQTLLERGGL